MKYLKYQPTIGLEVHIELKTKTKMFCSCLNDPDQKRPNFNICPICAGHPGTLPVINEEAVKKVIKTGLALGCKIPKCAKFDRKNYFYPDLPKGYQISQYDMPFCEKGFLEIQGKKIRIRRVHLEEDTGRLIHKKDCSLVDFNRAGIPLMELVTEPDLGSAKEVKKFAEELRLILRYLGVSEANMEKGQLRVEANISLLPLKSQIPSTKSQINPKHQIPNSKLGTKVEIKNLNSFKGLERAVNYEIKRQTKILETKNKVIQETRGWNENRGETVSQREKEGASDYRYFPEPDLPMLCLGNKDYISKIKAEIPELPPQKRKRFAKEYHLLNEQIDIFVQNKKLGQYFEKVVSELPAKLKPKGKKDLIKLSANYLITELTALLKGSSVASESFLISAQNFAEFIALIFKGKISSRIAKMVLSQMFKTGADPSRIIKEKDLLQITDEKELERTVKEIISKNPKVVEDYKKGKENALQFLIGQVMRQTRGRASPQIVNKILKKSLR